MTRDSEKSYLKEILVGVVIIVIGGVILAYFEKKDDPPITINYSPRSNTTSTSTYRNSSKIVASECMTQYGPCSMKQAVSPGTYCVCYDVFGFPQIVGIAR